MASQSAEAYRAQWSQSPSFRMGLSIGDSVASHLIGYSQGLQAHERFYQVQT